MFTGLTTNMCLAFGAGILVGAGAGCLATSHYYRNRDKHPMLNDGRTHSERISALLGKN